MTNFVTSSTPSICKNEQWISGFFKKKNCKHVTKFKTQPPRFMSTLQMYSHYNENALLMICFSLPHWDILPRVENLKSP